jgi:hypothetical protein
MISPNFGKPVVSKFILPKNYVSTKCIIQEFNDRSKSPETDSSKFLTPK